jgi:cytochrome c-type biogenesis protein
MTGGVPLTIALVAGGLSTLNPCSFPLLPAFLSFYVGADEKRLPPAAGRILQGLLVGLCVTLGYLAVFALVSLPITYGVRAVADALPWLGVGIGIVLAVAGALVLAGRSPSLTLSLRPSADRRRGLVTMLVFGAAYGTASLGCALPLFLALVGTSLSAQGEGSAVAVFLAFAGGIAVMLTAVSVAAALAREGLARRLRALIPYVTRIAGGLLVLAGGYLTYYWLRLELGSNATLADDPIVGFGTQFTARLQALAAGEGELVLIVAASIVLLAVTWSALALRREGRVQ